MSAAPCIWITRPPPGADESDAVFRQAGFATRCHSLLNVQTTENINSIISHISIHDFQSVLITSSHALAALSSLPPDKVPPLAVVGTATAAKARASGYIPLLCGDGEVNGLADVVVKQLAPENGKLLYLRGKHIHADLGATLRSRGFEVEEIIVYEAVAAGHLPDTLQQEIRGGTLHAATAYSRRSLGTLEELLRHYRLEQAARSMNLVCLSASIAKVATSSLWQNIVYAEIPEDAAMLKLFKHLYGSPPRITTDA